MVLARLLAERMAARGSGHLLFISSLVGQERAGRAARSTARRSSACAASARACARTCAARASASPSSSPGSSRDAGHVRRRRASKLPEGRRHEQARGRRRGRRRARSSTTAARSTSRPVGMRLGATFAGLAPGDQRARHPPPRRRGDRRADGRAGRRTSASRRGRSGSRRARSRRATSVGSSPTWSGSRRARSARSVGSSGARRPPAGPTRSAPELRAGGLRIAQGAIRRVGRDSVPADPGKTNPQCTRTPSAGGLRDRAGRDPPADGSSGARAGTTGGASRRAPEPELPAPVDSGLGRPTPLRRTARPTDTSIRRGARRVAPSRAPRRRGSSARCTTSQQRMHLGRQEARRLAVAVGVVAALRAVVVAERDVDRQRPARRGSARRRAAAAPRRSTRSSRPPCRPGSCRRRPRARARTATPGPWPSGRSRARGSPRRGAAAAARSALDAGGSSTSSATNVRRSRASAASRDELVEVLQAHRAVGVVRRAPAARARRAAARRARAGRGSVARGGERRDQRVGELARATRQLGPRGRPSARAASGERRRLAGQQPVERAARAARADALEELQHAEPRELVAGLSARRSSARRSLTWAASR